MTQIQNFDGLKLNGILSSEFWLQFIKRNIKATIHGISFYKKKLFLGLEMNLGSVMLMPFCF
jgi:hypothetical protein